MGFFLWLLVDARNARTGPDRADLPWQQWARN